MREDINKPSKTTETTEKTVETVGSEAKSGRGGVLVFALILAAAALGLSGWQYYQSTQTTIEKPVDVATEIAERVSGLESRLAAEQSQALQAFDDRQRDLQQQLNRIQSSHQTDYEQLQTVLQTHRQRLLELGSADRDDWMLAETEYLLRLANQRLIMAADVTAAEALLTGADSILKQLDDVELYPTRQSIANDLAALRAVTPIDVEGTWLRIQALVGQVDSLVLFELPVLSAPTDELPEAAGLEQRLRSGLSAAAQKLSDYVIIRRRQAPYEALTDPQWEAMVRQNLRMLLEQIRASLLSGNQALYSQSIANTRRWLAEFFSFNESSVAALDRELASLADIKVQQDLPDIVGSVKAIKTAINDRHRLEAAQ